MVLFSKLIYFILIHNNTDIFNCCNDSTFLVQFLFIIIRQFRFKNHVTFNREVEINDINEVCWNTDNTKIVKNKVKQISQINWGDYWWNAKWDLKFACGHCVDKCWNEKSVDISQSDWIILFLNGTFVLILLNLIVKVYSSYIWFFYKTITYLSIKF